MTYEDQSINFKLQQTSKTSRPEFQLKVTFKTRPSAKRFRDMFYFNTIRHFQISHNAPYYGTQNFSEALLSISLGMALIPRKKWKSKIKQNFGGQIRCIMGNV